MASCNLEEILNRISTIGSVIGHGTPSQQKEARAAMFERIEVEHACDVTQLAPRKWAAGLFDLISSCQKKTPLPQRGRIQAWYTLPARGLELTGPTNHIVGSAGPILYRLGDVRRSNAFLADEVGDRERQDEQR